MSFCFKTYHVHDCWVAEQIRKIHSTHIGKSSTETEIIRTIIRPVKINFMFLVSHFQKIGEGIFHFSLFFNIGQVWFFWKHKAAFLVYSIIDIEENKSEWVSFKQFNTIIKPEFILGRFICFAASKKCSVVNSNRTNFKAVMVSICS